MEEQSGVQNVYLEEVLQKQEVVDRELKLKPAAAPLTRGRLVPDLSYRHPAQKNGYVPAEEPVKDERSGPAVDYRLTGWGPWQTVVVPPNVYVVHTRRDHAQPVHIGLGISFRFRPATDAFLVVPAAVQTILINANCICAERQGILVQAYVQWIIGDIGTAYRMLDFSDPHDPMRLVNVQLREQAEAAIKDKVATMSIDEVLSDKQPIIDELTHRLRAVAEGNREDGSAGLGLKIVTVQIKEAVVSSARVWQNLQLPFRADREKLAHLAQLASQQEIAARELENRVAHETADLAAQDRLAQLRAANEQAQFDREQAERIRRHKLEQEVVLRAEREKLGRLAILQSQQEIAARELENRVAHETADLAAQDRLAQLRAANEQAQYDREQAERIRRHKLEQEAKRQAVAEEGVTVKARRQVELDLALQELELEKRRLESEMDRVRARMEMDEARARQERAQVAAELEVKELRDAASLAYTQRELVLLEKRREIENDLSERHVQAQLIARLPEIAEHLPAPAELRTTVISADGPGGSVAPLLHFLAGALSLLDGAPKRAGESQDAAG